MSSVQYTFPDGQVRVVQSGQTYKIKVMDIETHKWSQTASVTGWSLAHTLLRHGYGYGLDVLRNARLGLNKRAEKQRQEYIARYGLGGN